MKSYSKIIFIVFFPVIVLYGKTMVINEVMAKNSIVVADDHNEYDDWIEIYNSSSNTIDIAGYYFSDEFENLTKWQIPSGSQKTKITAHGFMILWADEQTEQGVLHLNFKLSGKGDRVAITAPDGITIVDTLSFGRQQSNISYGLKIDGGSERVFFSNPTPGTSNNGQTAHQYAGDVGFSKEAGFYSQSFTLKLSASAGEKIYYTTDGKVPNTNSNSYTVPIEISNTTVLRAVAIKDGALPGKIITHSYIFDNNLHLPVFSLVTAPENLTGRKGILSNRYKNWEKPTHVEYFNSNKQLVLQQDAGVKVHAADNRRQQSLRLYARSGYGEKKFKYAFFKNTSVSSFKRLILRNGANDGIQVGGRNTNIRDLVAHTLFSERSPDNSVSQGQQVDVFLNGQYYGIYNLRERQDKYYIEDHFNEDDIDFLERDALEANTRHAIAGDWTAYNSLEDYVKTHDLSVPENYEHIKQLMDVDNFAEYYLFEIYVGNRDWLSNNIKFWRPRSENGKWRWILWDTEYGLGRDINYSHGRPEWNCLVWATSPGAGWRNTGDNTILIRGLLKNESFKNMFVNRFADMMNSIFLPEHVAYVIDSLKNVIKDDVPRHIKRWGGMTIEKWNRNIESLKQYFVERPAYVRQHIINKFNLDENATYKLTVKSDLQQCGVCVVNTAPMDKSEWEGIYFKGIPVTIKIKQELIDNFIGWEKDGRIFSNNPVLTINSQGDLQIKACFSAQSTPSIIINEINYNSSEDFKCKDWVEIFNAEEDAVNISGWQLKDDDDNHIFVFPENTILNSSEYLVIVRNQEKFSNLYQNVDNFLGEFSFGFGSDSDKVRLYNSESVLVDIVSYKNSDPWPQEADGTGYTLSLKSTDLNNELAENWAVSSEIGGTPGEQNVIQTAITSVSDVPQVFSLEQNYPNPFNPSTNIRYMLPRAANVTLTVYNILGQKIKTLVNNFESAGLKNVFWDGKDESGSSVSSGMYFFRIIADSGEKKYAAMKKGVLLK